MKFKVGDLVWYKRFDRKDNEYIGVVLYVNLSRSTILIDCGGEKYLAPDSKLELIDDI